MNSLMAILPVFIIILAGYALRALHVVKPSWVSALNGFVYYVALPALIIQSFAAIRLTDSTISRGLLANLGVVVLIAVVLACVLKLSKLSNKLQATIFLTVLVGNTVYLGIPVVSASLPDASLTIVAAVGAVQLVAAMIISLIAIEWLFLKSRNNKRITMSLIQNPLIISLAIGIIFSFVRLPTLAGSLIAPALKVLAATASPLALFTLGAFLQGHTKPKRLGLLLSTGASKLVITPLIFLYMLPFLGVTQLTNLHTSIILAAMPTAVTAFVLAETYKLDQEFAAGAMVTTTILSLITLPIIISLLAS